MSRKSTLVSALGVGALIHFFSFYLFPSLILYVIFVAKLKPEYDLQFNAIHKYGPISDKSTSIVYTCPDFLYGLSLMRVKPDTVYVLNVPASKNIIYGNFAIYNIAGRLIDLVRYSDNGLKLIVKHTRTAYDNSTINNIVQQMNISMDEYNSYQVVEIKNRFTFGINRLFVPNKSQLSKLYPIHESINSYGIQLSNESIFNLSNLTISNVMLLLMTLLMIFEYRPLLKIIKALSLNYKKIVTIGFVATLFSFILSGFVVKILRNPFAAYKFGFIDYERSGTWEYLSINVKSNVIYSPYEYFYFFLNGALGLPPSEVYYGLGKYDSNLEALNANNSYIIHINKNLSCEWWSLSVYGKDKHLIPNELDVFSINSHSSLGESFDYYDYDTYTISNLWKYSFRDSSDDLKVYVSATKPDVNSVYANMHWIPLNATHSETFVMLLRTYVPDHKVWNTENIKNIQLPVIEKL